MTRGEKGRVEPLDQPDDWCVRRALLTEGEAYRSILPLSLSPSLCPVRASVVLCSGTAPRVCRGRLAALLRRGKVRPPGHTRDPYVRPIVGASGALF
jgi:hypothetical protein